MGSRGPTTNLESIPRMPTQMINRKGNFGPRRKGGCADSAPFRGRRDFRFLVESAHGRSWCPGPTGSKGVRTISSRGLISKPCFSGRRDLRPRKVHPSGRLTCEGVGHYDTDSNSSTGLPSGSSARICLPPGPTIIALRKRIPACFNSATREGRSFTSRTSRFHPPGSGRRPSGIVRAAEPCGPPAQPLADADRTPRIRRNAPKSGSVSRRQVRIFEKGRFYLDI